MIQLNATQTSTPLFTHNKINSNSNEFNNLIKNNEIQSTQATNQTNQRNTNFEKINFKNIFEQNSILKEYLIELEKIRQSEYGEFGDFKSNGETTKGLSHSVIGTTLIDRLDAKYYPYSKLDSFKNAKADNSVKWAYSFNSNRTEFAKANNIQGFGETELEYFGKRRTYELMKATKNLKDADTGQSIDFNSLSSKEQRRILDDLEGYYTSINQSIEFKDLYLQKSSERFEKSLFSASNTPKIYEGVVDEMYYIKEATLQRGDELIRHFDSMKFNGLGIKSFANTFETLQNGITSENNFDLENLSDIDKSELSYFWNLRDKLFNEKEHLSAIEQEYINDIIKEERPDLTKFYGNRFDQMKQKLGSSAVNNFSGNFLTYNGLDIEISGAYNSGFYANTINQAERERALKTLAQNLENNLSQDELRNLFENIMGKLETDETQKQEVVFKDNKGNIFAFILSSTNGQYQISTQRIYKEEQIKLQTQYDKIFDELFGKFLEASQKNLTQNTLTYSEKMAIEQYSKEKIKVIEYDTSHFLRSV